MAADPDLVVLGAGSAGFAAAIRASDLGARVMLIEGGTLGGTCVNVGCIPSKTLLRAADVQHRAAHHPFDGIPTAARIPDLKAAMAQKDALVTSLRHEKYEDVLAAYPAVTLRRSRGILTRDRSIVVDGDEVRPTRIVVTTGASPWAPAIPGLAASGYWNSTDALAQTRLPASLIVIGGSAVGLEIGQLYSRLGTKVTVLEAAQAIVPAEDAEIGVALADYLRQEAVEIHVAASIGNVTRDESGFVVKAVIDRAERTFHAERLLVATGRRANTTGLELDAGGVELGPKGEIKVNDYLETSRPGVYAAGDVIGDPMFVYVAAYAGNLAAENALAGNTRRYDLAALPRVTFTDPQVAAVGALEDEARVLGVDVAVSKLPLSYVSRAVVAHDTRGFIKLIADRRTDRLVGAHILAPEAGEMIQETAMAIRHGLTVRDLANAFHPYLTFAEGVKLAAQAFEKDVKKLSCCAG